MRPPREVTLLSELLGLRAVGKRADVAVVRVGARTVRLCRPVYSASGSGQVVANIGLAPGMVLWRAPT